jgi:hypothetical protein
MYPAVWEEWQTRPNPIGVGLDLDRQLAIYHRWAHLPDVAIENIVVVLNFSDEEHQLEVPFPTSGRWEDLLAGFDGQGGPWSVEVGGPLAVVPVSSHWGRVLRRLNPAP